MREKGRYVQSQDGTSQSNESSSPTEATNSPNTTSNVASKTVTPIRDSKGVVSRLEAQEAKMVAKAIVAAEKAKSRLAKFHSGCAGCAKLNQRFAQKTLDQAEAVIAGTRPRIVRAAHRLIHRQRGLVLGTDRNFNLDSESCWHN